MNKRIKKKYTPLNCPCCGAPPIIQEWKQLGYMSIYCPYFCCDNFWVIHARKRVNLIKYWNKIMKKYSFGI